MTEHVHKDRDDDDGQAGPDHHENPIKDEHVHAAPAAARAPAGSTAEMQTLRTMAFDEMGRPIN